MRRIRVGLSLAVLSLVGWGILGCKDPNPTFVFDASSDGGRTDGAAGPSGDAGGGAGGAGGAAGNADAGGGQ